MKNLKEELNIIINNTEVFDIHTHLFPSNFKTHYLSGIGEVLNYHYLIAELLTSTNTTPNAFYNLNNNDRAKLIWEELFIKQTPVSEACKGVLTILSSFEIDYSSKSFDQINTEYLELNLSDQDILHRSKISSLVMTNNPFDLEEWKLFEKKDWNSDVYLASLRLDDILLDPNKCIQTAKNKIQDNLNERDLIIKYLDIAYEQSKPVYAAISLNKDQLNTLIENKIFSYILEWLKLKNLPLSLLLGVKRQVNKEFFLAGDGIDRIDLSYLSKLCNKYPKNKFLCSCLSLNDQHELTVLGRKHSNMRIFGFWWFMNQPTLIEMIMNLRIELLGFNFIPQHSDARVTDQLIYKWSHFKVVLNKILFSHYSELILRGFKMSEEKIITDVNKLLSKNALDFIS